MNCYLSWNLNEMTNISAEKLQRNISQQVSYIELYKDELVKEASRFNIASLLKFVVQNKNIFRGDPFSKKATDCLIVFLHAMALQKTSFFVPSDEENGTQTKGCRNLHRLMLENLKATMRYLDYVVLLDKLNSKTNLDEMFQARESLYSKVFPEEKSLSVSTNEEINNAFFSIVEAENSLDRSFLGYDVKGICNLEDSICEKLSLPFCSCESLENSQYGIIGSCASYLETPFIKHSGRYFSFVTKFSLNRIKSKLSEPQIEIPASYEVQEEPPLKEEPSQTFPLLSSILGAFQKPNPVTQYIANCSEQQKSELSAIIEKALLASNENEKDKIFTIPETTISVCIFRNTKDPMLDIQRKENLGAIMVANERDSWDSLELYVNSLGNVVRTNYCKITKSSFSDWEWKIVEKLGKKILDRGNK